MIAKTTLIQRSGRWWLADSLGAICIAGGLALFIAGHVGEAVPAAQISPSPFLPMPFAWLVPLLLGGAFRALTQAHATRIGQAAANITKHEFRQKLIPVLLPSLLPRARLIGEDVQLAIDATEAQEGRSARFLPLRRAAMLSPLLIALAVAPASWPSALILLATLIPFGMAMALAGTAARTAADAQQLALSRLSGLFVDRVRSLPAILAFGVEDRIARHLGHTAHELAERTLKVLRIAFLSSATLEFFAALSVALVAVYCGFSLLGLLPFPAPEQLSLGRAFFVLALAPEFYLGMRRMAAAYHDKQQGEAAQAAIEHELARVPQMPVPLAAAQRISPKLEGKHVILRHADGMLIGPLNWSWQGPGLHAVTGSTGAGKSSLLLSIVGQVPMASGRLSRDGEDFTAGALNASIGWAGQAVALLPGTLRDNLGLGSPEFDDGAARQCLDQLGLCAMIDMRGGLDMPLDHRGSGLSGGERRRIGLARAILSQRPILLLDEPTADLDETNAAAIRSILAELATQRLVIVATHDPALIAMARSQCSL